MALDHYLEGIRLGTKLPDGHPVEALSYSNASAVYYHLAQFAHARRLMEKAKTIREEILGDHHVDTATVYNNYGACLVMMGEPQAALEFLTRARDTFVAELGHEHPRSFTAAGNVARASRCTQSDFEVLPARKLDPVRLPDEFRDMVKALAGKKGKKKGKAKGKGKGKKGR
jgi:tetratricopeptide (TPR) repeat protein